MNNYLATLSPLEAYFFGTEKMSMAANRSDYFARTLLYPQQTTLLGMLRYEVLRKNNALQKRDNWSDLIGVESFSPNLSNQTFGHIQSLSPLFLSYGNDSLLPAPFDWNYEWSKQNGTATTNTQRLDFLPVLKQYKAKKGIIEQWLYGNTTVENSKIFKRFSQVGHAKNRKGESDDESFFLQEYVQMDKEYGFSFFVTLPDNTWDGYKSMVKMGGQQSPFVLKLTKTEISFEAITTNILPFYKSAPYRRVVLWSDAFVEMGILKHTVFAVNEVREFRSIETNSQQTQKWSNLERYEHKPEQPTLSAKSFVLGKGSVLLFDNEQSLNEAKKMLGIPHLQNIGYNHFSII